MQLLYDLCCSMQIFVEETKEHYFTAGCRRLACLDAGHIIICKPDGCVVCVDVLVVDYMSFGYSLDECDFCLGWFTILPSIYGQLGVGKAAWCVALPGKILVRLLMMRRSRGRPRGIEQMDASNGC